MARANLLATAVTAVVLYLYSQTPVLAVDSDGVVEVSDVRTDDVVVTATRFPETELNQPVNVTVISKEEIERSPAKTVPEVLAAEVGFVNSELFGNNGANTSIDLRGFGATGGQNTLILVDGRRVSDTDLSGVKWSAIPLDAIERIEIVRGSGSVLYGNGAVSGVVNIITKTPLDRSDTATIGARYGDLDTRAANVNATYRSETFGVSVETCSRCRWHIEVHVVIPVFILLPDHLEVGSGVDHSLDSVLAGGCHHGVVAHRVYVEGELPMRTQQRCSQIQ